MQDPDSNPQLRGLYDEVESTDAVVKYTGIRLGLYLAWVCLKILTPVVLIPILGFVVFTRCFGMPWGWALVPVFFLGTFSLSASLQNSPVLVGQPPPLIRFRMKAIYYTIFGSITASLVLSPPLLSLYEMLRITAILPWWLVCSLSLAVPLFACWLVAMTTIVPRIDALKFEGGRSRSCREPDGTVVYVREID